MADTKVGIALAVSGSSQANAQLGQVANSLTRLGAVGQAVSGMLGGIFGGLLGAALGAPLAALLVNAGKRLSAAFSPASGLAEPVGASMGEG